MGLLELPGASDHHPPRVGHSVEFLATHLLEPLRATRSLPNIGFFVSVVVCLMTGVEFQSDVLVRVFVFVATTPMLPKVCVACVCIKHSKTIGNSFRS